MEAGFSGSYIGRSSQQFGKKEDKMARFRSVCNFIIKMQTLQKSRSLTMKYKKRSWVVRGQKKPKPVKVNKVRPSKFQGLPKLPNKAKILSNFPFFTSFRDSCLFFGSNFSNSIFSLRGKIVTNITLSSSKETNTLCHSVVS